MKNISTNAWRIIGAVAVVVLALIYFRSDVMHVLGLGETSLAVETETGSPIAFYKNPAFQYQFSYAKKDFTLLESQITLNDIKQPIVGVKLLPVDRAAKVGKDSCMYGESGMSTTCNVASENGIFFGVIKTDIETALSGFGSLPMRMVNIADVDVVQYSMGAEGSGVDYFFWPMSDNTTLVVARNYTTQFSPKIVNSSPTNEDLMLLLNALTFPGIVKNSQANEADHK